MGKNLIKNIRYFILLFVIIVIFFLAINFYVIDFSKNKIKDISQIEKTKIALVLGASVKPNGIPSDILADRLKTSYEAYKLGKISKIIVSGDNRKRNYNEPEAMKKYLINLGVNPKDIQADYAGFDTYDSIYRAKEIFGVKKMIVFTQEYHLYRALYIANKLGIESYGVVSDRHKYFGIIKFKTRELLSRVKAFFEVEIFKSKPKFLGDKIEIK